MDIGVRVERREVRGDYRIPDDGLGRRGGGWVGGGVGGSNVEEDLFRVPIKKRAQICDDLGLGADFYGGHARMAAPASKSNLTWAYSSRLAL